MHLIKLPFVLNETEIEKRWSGKYFGLKKETKHYTVLLVALSSNLVNSCLLFGKVSFNPKKSLIPRSHNSYQQCVDNSICSKISQSEH